MAAPAITLVPARSAALTRALRDLSSGGFAWIVLTSPATVAMLVDRLSGPTQVRARVAVIGDGTAAAFRAWADRDVDLRPGVFTTQGLARAFPRGRGRVLCARADIAPEGLEDRLISKGWSPLRVDAYRTRLATSLPAPVRRAFRDGEVDAVTFTSASTVRGFVAAGGLDAVIHSRRRPRMVCIGPVTSREARAQGLWVSAVAKPHTADGLLAALERALAPRGRPKGARATIEP